ncbi:polysaccharide deacetylase family protein [Streptomyces sp. G1]|uniref:polysaccharide deacetylase family protein n=1 Tax=Streptomyces sp. G1 TaxID=361572 RepID=UPI00202E4AEA|nr:polysaccharide deacetylase family protein [Streptomyces sp. G1]MCM1966513.1 polysaccharide deacetylase family protein [Streptomyces sp. G1]
MIRSLKRRAYGTSSRRAATAAAALVLAALTGCSSLNGVVSPAAARNDAVPAGAKRAPGPVDCKVAKCVALTFDGGPSEPTPGLLDVLKREKVPATFFLQGKGHTDTYPDTVRRMADEGHEIANHTWSHEDLTTLTPDGIRAEIEPVQHDIEKATGRAPTLMRPPGGATNDDVSKVMKDLGLAQILWSVTAKDFQTTDTALIEKRVLDQTERDGIILLHERYAGTIPAVPGIIAELHHRGYTFVTVSELLAPARPEPGKVYRP